MTFRSSSCLPVLMLVAVGAWGALAARRIRRGREAIEPSAGAWALLPVFAGIAFWFWASPEPRYAYGIMWTLAAVSVAVAVDSWRGPPGRRARLAVIGLAAALLVPTVVYRAAVLRVLRGVNPLAQMPFRGPGPDRGFHPTPQATTVVGRTTSPSERRST